MRKYHPNPHKEVRKPRKGSRTDIERRMFWKRYWVRKKHDEALIREWEMTGVYGNPTPYVPTPKPEPTPSPLSKIGKAIKWWFNI